MTQLRRENDTMTSWKDYCGEPTKKDILREEAAYLTGEDVRGTPLKRTYCDATAEAITVNSLTAHYCDSSEESTTVTTLQKGTIVTSWWRMS